MVRTLNVTDEERSSAESGGAMPEDAVGMRPDPDSGGLPSNVASRLRIALLISAAAALVCFVLAYRQPFGVSRDYADYEAFFDALRAQGPSVIGETRFEPGFVLLAYLASLVCPSSLSLYALLAAVAAGVKFFVFHGFAQRRSAMIPVALFYFVRFMPLHELTQLRASLAIAMLLVAFRLVETGRTSYALAVSCAAATFHMSAAAAIPFLLMRVSRRRWVVVVLAATGLTVFLASELLMSHLTPLVTVLEMYEHARQMGEEFDQHNVLSLAVLLESAFMGGMLAFWRLLSRPMRHAVLLQGAGLVVFLALGDWPLFGVRIHELLGVFSVLVLVQGVTAAPPVRSIAYVYMALSAMGYGRIHFFSATEPLFE